MVIVHYKTPGLLADCVGSVLPEIDAARDEVVIVDAASGEEHVSMIRHLGELPGVTLIESEKNLGFAGGNNIALRHVLETGGAEYFMLLNPDTLVRPGAFALLREFLEKHPDAGMVGPRLEHLDGTPQLSAFGRETPVSEFIRGANIGPITRLLKRWEVYGELRHEPHPADWLSGACILTRGEVLQRAGLLDDGYFMYFEEEDWFLVARRHGYHAWHLPAARVVHLVGRSSGIVNQEKAARRLPAYWFESRHRYFRKHFGYFGMVAADAAWLSGHTLNCLRRLVTGVSHSAVARFETRDLLRHSVREMKRLRIRSPEVAG
ncbi:MAG: glycosyltransferase family 2 protein [Phycisphaerae bacterium]